MHKHKVRIEAICYCFVSKSLAVFGMWSVLPLLELLTLWCLKQTHKRQKILTRQFSLDQGSASMCSFPLSSTKTKWLTVAPPYIPDAVVPAPHLGFVQVRGSQSFPIG
jgi:hypothetical protein